MHRYRTHTCGELSLDHVRQTARLAGWVHRLRDHGGLLFVDLRDHYGLTQCVLTTEHPEFDSAQSLRLESVVCVTGTVRARSEDTINPNLATGAVEIAVEHLEVLSRAEPLPLPVNTDAEYPETTRLTYRYLDLRRERMHAHLVLRSKVIASLRRRMQEQGFLEIQTPILTASSPEGARDYLVPSRVHPGRFYALPQAPQLFKQLLMVAGVDRYFQIAPCFRDEEARADRSPGEFYQLDLEMAFVEQEDVFAAVEPALHGLFEEFSDRAVTRPPFPRIPYSEAMLRYGTDKPDLRNPITMSDATALFADSDFQVFRKAIEKGAVVRAIPVAGIADRPRSFFDRLNDHARSLGAGGLAYVILGGESAKGPVAKFLGPEKLEKLRADCTGADVVFFLCDQPSLAARYGGEVRTHLGEQLDLLSKDVYEFCWVVDFPLYEWDEDAKAIDFSHNPFSMPQGGMEALETEDPLQILAYQYDIVCNGIELSSGAIRNHLPELMVKVFERVGYRREDLERRFPGLFNAFRYGAPPHGGLAPGIDRIIMLLADEPNLREVIAFPMNQHAQDLMMGAPSEVAPEQLAELHIRVVPPKRKP